MVVFCDGEDNRVTGRIAADDDGDFKLEVEHFLEYALDAAETAESFERFFTRSDARLAFAVVAKSSSLQNAGEKRRVECLDIGFAADGRVRCGRHARLFDEGFFDVAVLCRAHRRSRRRRAHAELGQALQGVGGHVFKFRCYGANVRGEFLNALGAVIGGANVLERHFGCRSIFTGFEYGDVITHGGGSLRKHAPELSAAQKAQRLAGQQHFVIHLSSSGGRNGRRRLRPIRRS